MLRCAAWARRYTAFFLCLTAKAQKHFKNGVNDHRGANIPETDLVIQGLD